MASQYQQVAVSRRRAVLLVVILLTAVMLWLLLRSGAVIEDVTETVVPAPSEDLFQNSSVADATAPAAVTQVPLSLDGFNVSVRLQYESTNAVVLSRVREYYDALVSGLRAVPGLQLVDDHAVSHVGGQAEFRVTVSSLDASNAEQIGSTFSEWAANVSVEVLTGDAAGTVYVLGMIGDAWKERAAEGMHTRGPLSGECATRTLMPCTPGDIAKKHVMALRKHVFPRGSLEREIEAQFLDASQPEPERQQLRNDLKSMDIVLSDTMVREALARLARPPDTSSAYAENERYDILIILAGQRHKAIVEPLIDHALHDSDVSFRIEALRLLAKDFPENSAVRTALEKLALDSSDPLQKMAAEMLSRISGN
jgi:hypothetical protein